MESTFNLSHTVLYSKGWYQRGDLWKDLQKLLEADGYTMWESVPNKHRIANLIVRQSERLENVRAFSLSEFFSGIQDENIWKRGYYTNTNAGSIITKEDLATYDYCEAVVRYCLSVFGDLKNDQWKKQLPDYEKVLPKKPEIDQIDIDKSFKK